MNEIDILNKEIGGVKIQDMSSMVFLQWLAGKLNNVRTFSAVTVELTALVTNPPMSRTMPDDEKVKIIKKLDKIGIQI